MKCFSLGLCLAVIVMFMGLASSANALTLWITDGSNFVSVTDGGLGDNDADAGELSYNGTVGNFNIVFGGGSSKNVANPDPTMDFGGFVTSNKSGGFLRMWLTDTDMNNAVPSLTATVSATVGKGGQAGFGLYRHLNNNPFGNKGKKGFIAGDAPNGLNVTNLGPFAAWGGFESKSGLLKLSPTGDPFSMTMTADILHTGASSTSFNFATSVPEPGTIILLGLGFLGMGFYARKRQA